MSLVMKAPRPDQHFGGLERIISQPQLPDYAAIIAVVSRVGEVLSVQVGLETAGNVYKLLRDVAVDTGQRTQQYWCRNSSGPS